MHLLKLALILFYTFITARFLFIRVLINHKEHAPYITTLNI